MFYQNLNNKFAFLWILIIFSFPVLSQTNSPLENEKIRYANSVLKTAIENNDSLNLAEAYYLFGKIESSKYNFQKSNEWLYKAL